MNTITVKILTFLLCTFVIITVISQLYMHFNVEYETETALSYSSATKESFYGIFVRDEQPIKYSGEGVISYSVVDGSKVANDSVVACVYGSEDPIIVNSRIERLENEIALLEAAQSPGTTEAVKPEFLSTLIEEQYQSIATKLSKKTVSDINVNRDEFLSLMSIYQIAINEEDSYDDRIDELYRQLNELEARRENPKREVTVDNPGYFVSYTDGYEDELNKESISSLSADRIKEIITAENSGGKGAEKGTIGKLIDGYDWQLVGIIDNSENTYSAGDPVKLKFASTTDTVTAVIELITDTDDPDESIVQIACDQMTFDLVRNRVERVDMILHDYEGIRVPREAIRFNTDNEKGVYVLLGQRVMFRKLDVIFECDEYLLSRITSESGYVSIYDEIITEGVDTMAYLAGLETEEEEAAEAEESAEETSVTVSETEEEADDDSSENEEDSEENEETDTEESEESEDTEETEETEVSEDSVLE